MHTFIAATRDCVSLYVPESVAGRLHGGIRAKARMEEDRIIVHFTGGHPTGRGAGSGFSLVPYRLSGQTVGRWGSVKYQKIEGWGRRMPRFGKTEARSCKMQDIDGVPTLVVVMPPVDELRPVLRGRSSPRPGPASAAPVASSTDACSLRVSVRQVNDRKREMGDSLVLSIDDDGILHAMVEYT